MHRGAPTPQPGAARAVARVLDAQRARDDAAEAQDTGRRARGRAALASAIDGEVAARLAAQAAGQQRALLSRLVSRDPTKKARAPVPTPGAGPTQCVRDDPDEVDASPTQRQRRRRNGQLNAPITVEEFDEKYATNDPMLHYLINVIVGSRSVTRSDIPRPPERLIDAQQRYEVPEEDVVFLVYHRLPPCGFRNVYWLEFITEDRAIDEEFEYFALSHHGFTHYRGSSVIDFVDVESWVIEKRAFDHMTAMRGLQKLQGLLFFMSWKKMTIRMKHRRVRDRLACSLFQCDSTAAHLLVAIRGCCVKIEELAASHHLPHRVTHTIDYIHQHNRARLRSIRLGIVQQDEDMCRLIERELWSLRQQRDAEETAERQNYSSVSRSSRLLDRLYVFLRLVDLHRFESLSAHMSEFIADLHAQICGDELRPEMPTRGPPNQQALHAIESTAASIAQLPTISIQRPTSIIEAATLVVSYKTHFSLRHREVPPPFVFGQVIDNVSLGSDPSNTQLSTSPGQLEVFDVVYALLNGYVTALDSVPQLLSDRRFSYILAPYTPENRDKFMASLLKPSTQILLDRTKDMKQMKYAIETYFKQLEILESDLLRLVVDIHVAEENETQKKLANERSSTVASSLLTAAQYEEIRDVWRSLLIEIQQLPRFVQVGLVLLDQSSLLDRLEAYVTNHINSMMDALPDVYKQCLCDLLEDADGRIERIMNIPTSIRDAIQWLKGMIEMMPTHANRKAFDAKCANLVRLKQLLRDTGASFPSAEDQDYVKKKDYEWESMYETLMTCFARVQERDCEHRRSILELNGKADECVDVQLEHIKGDYGKLPPYSDEPQLSKHKTRELADKKRALIDRLERLVAVHGERAEMLELYTTFEMEHRLLAEHTTFDAVERSRLPQRWVTKSPSELLLQHISVVFDMRAWFCAWLALEEKWIDTPLVSLHPSMIMSRLKQLRRRVQFASTRLISNATAPPDDEEFMARDYCLVEALEARVDEISNDYVIIQAATCGAFSTDRWQLCQRIMGMESINQNSITLRMVKSRLASAPHRIGEFKQLCEVVVLESKLRNAVERVRQRLSACEVSVCFTNTVVLLENIQDVVLELDDISIETKLLRHGYNPNLERVLAIHDEVHTKLALCSQLLSFQGVWDELCRLSRVHDIDEFFTGQVAWKGPHQRQKKKAGREESAWGDFVEVGQDWAERLRRLACMSQSSAATQQPSPSKTRVTASTPMKLACSLDEVQEAFHGFEFELAIAKCEGAYQLVDKYLAMVRDKCPRLYFLNKQQLIQFVVRDDDIETMLHALSICFPSISTFKIANSRREEEEILQGSGVRSTRGPTSDGSGSLVIKGVISAAFEQDFNVPVVKVGRLWFWLTRLEEEMGSLVAENAKQAVAAAFRRITGSDSPVAATDYQHHLPQSVQLALTLVFTSIVESVLWSPNTRESEAPLNSSRFCRSSSELKELYIKQLDTVIDFASGAGTHRLDARLDSMILLLQHQCEVSDHLHVSIERGRADDAAFLWDTQLKIDFMVEDLSAKTSRRFRACDQPTWTDCAILGPSFPVTFLATCGQSEFYVGQEMSGMRRIPVITPLTQRCFFELIRALRRHQLALVAPVNPTGRGGQGTMIKGMAQMLMRPAREMCRSRRGSISLEALANLLKSTTSMGCFLSIPHITELSTTAIRVVVENVNQLRQDTYRAFISSSPAIPEQRASLSLAPTGCVFVPLNCSSHGQSCRVRQVLFGSTADAFHPVAIFLPNVAYFTKTLALLAGFKITEIPKLQSVVSFLESLARLSPVLGHASSGIYRFISHLVEDVSRYRSNYRVLLPSNPKWSKKFAGAGNARSAPQRISKFFRRSADAHDVSDIVIDTLFHHAITARYKGFLSTLVSSTTRSLENDLIELAERCFPCSKGCELTLRPTQTQEQALWDAVEMSLAQAGLVTTTAGLVKALELYETLQSSAAVVVVGAPGAGKTTCIRTLHNAVQALELAELATSESGVDYPTQRSTKRDWSQLVCVSSRFLWTDSDIPDKRTRRLLGDILKADGSGVDMFQRRWLCIDGVIDESRAEAFVREYSRGGLHNHTNPKLVAASRRIILETTSLEQATPSFLVQTRVVHVSQTVTSTDLVSSWRDSWTKKVPFPEESRGYENAEVVFRMTEFFISGPVQQFVVGEENIGNLEQDGGAAHDSQVGPTHFGMLSLNHLTSSCLQLVSVACLTHRSQLEERSAAQLTRLVAFCVIWGFAGHLSEVYRQKLDTLLCPIVKQLVEVRQANETVEGLYDSERLGDDFWESIHLPLRGTAPPDLIVKDLTKSSVSRVIVDSTLLNRVLVVSSASLSLVRVLRLLLHSTASFMVVGPRGSGKSSLLRVLLAMNAEDQAAESLVDVSLDDRYAPEVLDWLNKPRTWFDRPATTSSNTSQFRSKAADEAQLFKLFSAGATKFVFLDDLAMADASGATSPEMDAVDEFVRVGLDHRMAINWTSDRVVPFAKEFAASMATRQTGTPKVRVTHHMERLVRHFSVFRMPHQDRQHLQGIFRHVYADWFVSSTVSMAAGVLASVPVPTRPAASNDRVLSLPEVVLRASVDLAVDVLTVQQTTERLELVDGFTFNLHHLNELLSRCLSFVQLLAAGNESSADAAGGATLLSLGKLHQCWSSSVRSVFLSPCSHRAPRAVEDELSIDLPIDEIKKVVQSTKLASEKYFSVPAREDPHAALVTDVVYGVYRYLADQREVWSSLRAEVGELLTANASASSSSSTTRRNGISEAGGTVNSGSVLARDEFAVRVARELVFKRVAPLLYDKPDVVGPANLGSRSCLRLHIGSSAGLHQLLHVIHGIRCSAGIFVDQPLSSTLRDVFRLAYATESYEVVEIDDGTESRDGSIRAQVESTLLAAITCGKRAVMWVNLDRCGGSPFLTDMIAALCTGKVNPILYESESLRDEAVMECVRDQRNLRLLSCDDAVMHFHDALRHNLRIFVVATRQGASGGLVELMRGSAAFQWVSFQEKDLNSPRYRGEVVRQAIHELTGQTQAAVSRQVSVEMRSDTRDVSSWGTLHSLCDGLFDAKDQRWSEDMFLMFIGNVVADCTRRVQDCDNQVDRHAQLVHALGEISSRVPRLQTQARLFSARMLQLDAWHDELQQPLMDLQAQLRDRVVFMRDKEAEFPSDELRALRRRIQKLETQVWAHRATMDEYKLAKAEVACRLRELDMELRHWHKYRDVRESVEVWSKTHLDQYQLVRGAQEQLLQLSVEAYSVMVDPKMRTEDLQRDLRNEPRGCEDGADRLVTQLWRSRFPFLREDLRAERILSVADNVHDRIPLIIDRSSLSQAILIHIFSNVPWFTDASEEYDRRDAIGYTVTGAVAPMIVQCDGGPKMWRKLNEAMEKETPVLLVGVSVDLIEPLSRFAKQLPQRPRSTLLAELTHEAYRSQLKRDVHAPKHPSHGSTHADPTMSSHPVDDRNSRRPGMASADFKSISAALVTSGAARRGSTGDPKGALARRQSLTLASGAVAASKSFGFQIYAVTEHAIDRALLKSTGQFAGIDLEWQPRSVEAFFTEGGMRWYDKMLHKDILDTRRIESDSTFRVLQAESTVWSIVPSQTCASPPEREEFMVRLEELNLELQRHRAQLAALPVRLTAVESRLEEVKAIGLNMAIVARATETFARCISPSSSMFLRSHRLLEQLMETTIAAWMKNDRDSSLQLSCEDWATKVGGVVATQVIQSVMTGLPSASHQRMFLAILANTHSVWASVEGSAVNIEARDDLVPPALAWLLWSGGNVWSRPALAPKASIAADKEANHSTRDPGESQGTVGVGAASASAPPSGSTTTGLSLVERLRRKVRVCSLMFDQIGNAKSKEPTQGVEGGPSTKAKNKPTAKQPIGTHTKVKPSSEESGVLDAANKTFRSVARIVRTLWCEWKLAKEDQHAEVRREIASVLGSQVSRPGIGGLRRRHRSVKDMTLASASVTQLVCLDDVVAQYLGVEATAESLASRSLDERLVVVMLAKAHFPQLFQTEWDRCLAASGAQVHSVEVSTTQLFRLDSHNSTGASPYPACDAASQPNLMAQQQLPPSIDVAWRRDDLVHLPTRVILYEPTEERSTIEVLLLRARESTQPQPLRLFAVVAWEQCAARLEQQLTASVTGKERFAVELSHQDHFSCVIALVSSIINQHALLCIPEWYVISTLQVFERVHSPEMGYHRIHVVRQAAEPASVNIQLTQWLIRNGGLGETEARTAANVLLRQASADEADATPLVPLSASVDALISKLKTAAQSGERPARQRRLKQLVLQELGLDAGELPSHRAVEAREHCVQATKASLEFLGDLLLLPPLTAPRTTERGLPATMSDLVAQLEMLCDALSQELDRIVGSPNPMSTDGPRQLWRSLLPGEHEATLRRVRALRQLLRGDKATELARRRVRDRALIAQGIVPVDWLTEHFPELSNACVTNVVSVAQVLVLLVSRLGFTLHDHSSDPPATLNVSLLNNPRSVVARLREEYAARAGCDPADVTFALQPGILQADQPDSKETEATAATQRGRQSSQPFARGLNQVGRQTSTGVAEKQITAPFTSCLVVGADGSLTGLQLEGLVAVERVTPSGGASQVFIHELPVCRLVCQHRQVDATQGTTARVDAASAAASSRQLTSQNVVTARLKQEGARLTTIASTSAFQTLPDSFWSSPGLQEPVDSEAILPRITVTHSLLVSVPSLARMRPEQDSCCIVLAVPVFPTDDDDQD